MHALASSQQRRDDGVGVGRSLVHGDQLGDRTAVFGDNDGFAAFNLPEESRQVGLGLVGADGSHSIRLVDDWLVPDVAVVGGGGLRLKTCP